MARDQTLLSSTNPIAIAPANPSIVHVQLRDLLICPRQQGLVNYVANKYIIEQDLHARGAPSRLLAKLEFTPNSLASLQVEEDATLIAAGGQNADLHLSYHRPSASSTRRSRLVWQTLAYPHHEGSINNSVLLTSLNLTGSHESSVEPRVGISNNDGSVRFYDVPMRVQNSRQKLQEVGMIKLEVPINHSSVSPDARTLLSVGDSNKVYFHRISGGARLSFTPITTLVIPAPDANPFGFSTSSLVASFSTAFSRDGSKFAVASQEGVVAVWDVRSTKPLKVFHSDKSRGLGGRDRTMLGNGAASGWLSDDPREWTTGTKAPGWCVRSVKFNSGVGARLGKEVMAFTEHTSVVHIVDALTFETHDIIRIPTIVRPSPRRHLRQSSAPSIIVSSPDANATQSNSRSTLIQRRPRRDARVPPPSRNTRRTFATSTTEPALRRSAFIPPAGGSPADGNGPSASTSATSSNQPGVIQALGDAFRIPASAYSAPSSIGDSTWRTLDDEVHLGPLNRRREMGSPTGLATRTTPFARPPPMPSLHALANYVLEPENVGELRDDVPAEMREDEGALSRRIRREESALRRGMEFGTGLFEDEEGSGSDTTEYAPIRSTARNGTYLGERRLARSDDGIVVVPDLGDRDVESEVHTVLAVHGIQSRLGRRRSYDDGGAERRDTQVDDEYDDYATESDRDTNTGSAHADYDYPLYGRRSRRQRGVGRFTIPSAEMIFDEAEEDAAVEDNRMDVDDIHEESSADAEEEDADCVSTNSRSTSPAIGSTSGSSFRNGADHKFGDECDYGFDDAESGAYYSGSVPSSSSPNLPNLTYYDDIDIAGLCFDPWGERLYVAGTGTTHDMGGREGLFSGAFGSPGRSHGPHDHGTVIEWGVRGAEKRFWVDEGWM